MPTQLQFRRGTTSQNNSFTGAAGELSVDTDTNGIRVHDGSTAGGHQVGAVISQDNSTNSNFNLYFNSTTSGALSTVKYDGGTLTFNPSTETLAVTNVTGTSSQAKYADVAENYIADASYEPGTVLVFGGKYECTICNSEQNAKIIGIVSEKPAYLMNKDLDADHVVAVALLGRVHTKVIGAVSKGDMMISSNEPGHCEAWKQESNPPSGTVLGKALEDKIGTETGVIEVLVGRL